MSTRTDFGGPTPGSASSNVMLYWDDNAPTQDILDVVEKWRCFCPNSNVVLFDKETASRYLIDVYGQDILRLFLTCAVPAMRSDFFRVFWAISKGGIYSDVRFVPLRDPLLFDSGKDLTVGRRPDGLIVNNFFSCKKDCKELKLIAFEIMKAISQKEIQHVSYASGPRLWTRILPNTETDTMAIANWRNDTREKFIEYSNYKSCTRHTHMHWTKVQRRMSIYHDHPEMPN